MISRPATPVLDLAGVVAATRADLVASPAGADPRAPVARVEPDASRIGRGDLFVALPGERVDGHDLVALAAMRGARAALVSRRWATSLAAVPLPLLVVEDPLVALLALATWWRERLGATVIGITGSVGKSTTKELLAAALAPHRTVIATPLNRNTALGVALTLLDARAGTEVVVLEVGGGGSPSEIADTCRVAQPDVGIVTSVHAVHLEALGTVEAVARSKADLVRAVGADGTVVLNRDDPFVRGMAGETAAPVRWFGHREGADVRADNVAPRGLGGVGLEVFTGGRHVAVEFPFLGDHVADAVVAAVAAAEVLGVAPAEALAAMPAAAPHLRPRLVEGLGGCRLIDDSYSASPPAVRSALRLLDRAGGRRVAVLGEMRELGQMSHRAHIEIGRYAVGRVDHLVCVGPLARGTGDGARLDDGRGPRVTFLEGPDADAVAAAVVADLCPDAVVLVKGSRALRMERVVDRLRA